LQDKVDALGLLGASQKNVLEAAGLGEKAFKGKLSIAPMASPEAGSSRELASPLVRQGSIRAGGLRAPAGMTLAAAVQEELAALV